MKELEMLKQELIKVGVDSNILNIYKDTLHINADDHQAMEYDGEYFHFITVSGSRYFYSEKFTLEQINECAEFIKKFASKTTEDINKEYDKIAGFLSK